MGRTTSDYDSKDPFNPKTHLGESKNAFMYGRTTAETCEKGLLPNPMEGCSGLKNIFVNNIYKESPNPWELTAAISGAHTLGGAKLNASGFDGFWSDAEN